MNTKTNNLTDILKISASIGLPSLLILENEGEKAEKIAKIAKQLTEAGFSQTKNYLGIMDALEVGDTKAFYVESEEKLDNLVFEIVAEYSAGIVSLMDREQGAGLKTVKFDPGKNSLLIIMTRTQVEESNPKLFEYVGVKESL